MAGQAYTIWIRTSQHSQGNLLIPHFTDLKILTGKAEKYTGTKFNIDHRIFISFRYFTVVHYLTTQAEKYTGTIFTDTHKINLLFREHKHMLIIRPDKLRNIQGTHSTAIGG